MKKILLSAILYCLAMPIFAQDAALQSLLATLTPQIKEVQAGDDKYAQTLKTEANKSYSATMTTIKTDKKGKATENFYAFNLADINAGAINYKIQKDIILVNMEVKASKKYVKHYENQKLDGFVNRFEIYVGNIDEARKIIDALKSVVVAAEKSYKPAKLPDNYESIEAWLKTNISSEQIGDENYEQSFASINKSLRTTFTQILTDKKGAKTEEAFEFNTGDLNVAEIAMDVKGDKLVIELATKKKLKYINYSENRKRSKNVSSFKIVGTDVDKMRAIEAAFKQLLPLAEKKLETQKPVINSLAEALTLISNNVKSVKDDEQTIDQSFKKDCLTAFTKKTTGKTTTEEIFNVNLADLNDKKIELDVDGQLFKLTLNSLGKFVTVQNNGMKQNYDDEIEFFTDDLEKIRYLPNAFEVAIKQCKTVQRSIPPSNNYDDILTLIKKQTPNFKNDKEELKQDFEKVSSSTCATKFIQFFVGDKKSNDILYEFSFKECNPEATTMDISGRNVYVILQTNNKEKIIKTYENGKPGNYTNNFKIQIDDIERARVVTEAVKQVIKVCK